MSHIRASLTIAPNGRLVIPANMRAELGCQSGGKLLARLEDGKVILEPIETAVRRAQALVNQYIPSNTGLASELIADRRAAAAIE